VGPSGCGGETLVAGGCMKLQQTHCYSGGAVGLAGAIPAMLDLPRCAGRREGCYLPGDHQQARSTIARADRLSILQDFSGCLKSLFCADCQPS
jgi:hypothetical protein